MMNSFSTSRSQQSALSVLTYQLSLLSLSAPLQYALVGMGASLVAAGVDGPIPVGDVIGGIVAAGSAVIIAFHYKEFTEKYDGICRAFAAAFAVTVFAQIKSSLDNLYNKCAALVSGSSSETVRINDQRVTMPDGTIYNCTTRAASLTDTQKRAHKYYPALLYDGDIYVDASKGIETGVCKIIIRLNHKKFGVFATSKSHARGVVGSPNVEEKAHGNTSGHYPHFHNLNFRNAHVWFSDLL